MSKDKDIYYLITNRSKFFQVFRCEKKVSSLSLDEALDNIRPLYEDRSLSKWFFKNVDVVENFASSTQKEALKDILDYAKRWKIIIQQTEEGCACNNKICDERLAIEAQRHISSRSHTHQLNSMQIKHHMSCSDCQQQVQQAPGFPKYRKCYAHIWDAGYIPPAKHQHVDGKSTNYTIELTNADESPDYDDESFDCDSHLEL